MGRFQNNSSIGWVHPKFAHACPLAWCNKKMQKNLGLLLANCVLSNKDVQSMVLGKMNMTTMPSS
jgi:hypothetical protein